MYTTMNQRFFSMSNFLTRIVLPIGIKGQVKITHLVDCSRNIKDFLLVRV